MRVFLGISIVFVFGLLIGAQSESSRHYWTRFLGRANIANYGEIRSDVAATFSDNHLINPQRVICPSSGRTMVVLIVGQSNVANYSEEITEAGPQVSTFYEGSCYRAKDPVLGATGFRGSVWPTFAERIMQSGKYDHVVLVPVAVGGSNMQSWAPGGVFYDRVQLRLSQLAKERLRLTHVVIGQGEFEADSREGGNEYTRYAVALIEALKSTGAEIYLATTGKCILSENTAIRLAQARVRELTGVLAGPDMDKIGPRINGCHLSTKASREVSKAWAEAVLHLNTHAQFR